MKINKLRLKNFRCYEDETEFDLTTNESKNIILIGGQNGAGKSTLFESIKLCIYGPLAYKYQGFNSTYINRIKSNLNNNAFKQDRVDAYVSIDLEIEEHTEKNIYTLTRKWTFKNKKLNENFLVYKNFSSTPLDKEKLIYFENYLKSIISPKTFEFFFFDGEHLSDFFVGKNANIHLKQSLLSLCNYDTFDILKTFTLSSIRRNKSSNSDNAIDSLKDSYLQLEYQLKDLKDKYDDMLNEIDDVLTPEIENLLILKKDAEASFRNKGGLLAKERDNLNKKLLELENRRGEINQNLKNFCNEMLPFLILKNQLPKLKKQINKEDEFVIYSRVKDKLNHDFIYDVLKDKIKEDTLEEIAVSISDALTENLKPNIDEGSFKPIHHLSNDEKNVVLSNINTVLGFNSNEIFDLYSELKSIGSEISEIRQKLDSSLDNKELNNYIKTISNITSEITSKIEHKTNLENQLEQFKLETEKIETQRDKAKKNYLEILQSSNIVDMSTKIIDLLDDIIGSLTNNKLREIEKNFMYIFRKLIRKDKFIDYISIDNNFNATLYINKLYNSIDIENMLENLGYDEMNKKLGKLFFQDLYREYNTTNRSQLLEKLKKEPITKLMNLRTKEDINSFSNGEKQIYILCLYWALIKASNINIPFVIDTPYARIDETHRKNIALEYFSTISNQVIILSTNTEIDYEAYKDIKEKINNEYLIQYDDTERKTKKSNGYFYGV